MARTKYFYNPETCSYERVRIRKRDLFSNFMGLFTAALLFAVVIMVVFNTYFDTPAEAALKKENRELKEHYTKMLSTLDEIEAMEVVLRQRDEQIHGEMYDGEPLEGRLINDGIIDPHPDALIENGFKDQQALNDFSSRLSALIGKVRNDNYPLMEYMGLARERFGDLDYVPTIQPIDNPELNALVTGFGKKINPYHHGIVEHDGIDFSAPRGTPVKATASGRVMNVKITEVKTGYGNRVEIDHGNGFITNYYHLDDIFVKKGDTVKKGSPIGSVGISGGTIAPSVHYEILRNGKFVDPINFFIEGVTESDYVKLLELALRDNQSLD